MGDNWDDYMSAKKLKLEKQFTEDVTANPKKCNIFNGISIFVNGLTDPTADLLRRMMIDYGGVYHSYYENGKTTYMIASMLPAAKINSPQYSRIKVIKPQWVTESIRVGKMLNYKQYLLLSQQDNGSFFKPRSPSDVQLTNTSNACDLDDDVSFSSDWAENTVSNHTSDVSGTITLNSSTQNSASSNTTTENRNTATVTKSKAFAKTARDDNFILEFYNNSRLHHLSTMSIKLKNFVRDLRDKTIHEFPGRERLKEWKATHMQNETFDANEEKCIMHIDLDCFFVSVGIRSRPELRGLPVAVAHATVNDVSRSTELTKIPTNLANDVADTTAGVPQVEFKYENVDAFDSMSELASCSYKAREYGIKNGMLIGQARKLCPQLKIIPYEFHAYEEVSYSFYKHLASYTLDIEAVSCDEMYIDCTEMLKYTNVDVSSFATILRKEIKEITGCTCSTGFGPNPLISRLATKIAKPDGQLYVKTGEVTDFMKNIPISHLPGVGRSIYQKLSNMGVKTCQDMQKLPVPTLQKEFGQKHGSTLHRRSFGEDNTNLNFTHQRKSLSADINYGIRFQTKNDAEIFLKKLALEIENRLKNEKLKGKSITVKFMVKSKNAPAESAKFLGHGVCDNITKTVSLHQSTSDSEIIFRIACKVMQDLNISAESMRGVGIQISRLEKQNSLKVSQHIDRFLVKKNTESGKETSKHIDEVPSKNYSSNSNDVSTFNTIVKRSSTSENSPLKLTNFSANAIIPISQRVSLGSYINFSEKHPKFSTLTPISEIAQVVAIWITKEDPQLSDIMMFFSFLKYLAFKNDFESFNFIVDCLQRCFTNDVSRKWKMVHSSLIKFIRRVCQKT